MPRNIEQVAEYAADDFDCMSPDEKFTYLPTRRQRPAAIAKALNEFNRGYLDPDDKPADEEDDRFIEWYVEAYEDEAKQRYIDQEVEDVMYEGR